MKEQTKAMTVHVPKELHRKLKALAVAQDSTIREIIVRLIREEIERYREQ